jgi:ATP-binding cassette subfamily G (WHITE) protein 2 (PDR)
VTQRALYEVRERPSKAYSWRAFLFANIIVELPYQIISGILLYACFYYPVVGVQASERQVLVLLYSIQFFVFASSFASMTIAALPDTVTASGVVIMLTLMSIVFCGVLQSPTALPGFWIFMYRVSPFTYWIGGIVSTMLHSRLVECSPAETMIFNPPENQTCGQYLAGFLEGAIGQLQNPDDTQQCRYCSVTVADQFLQGSKIFWTERWRNFGIVWAYVIFNIFVAALTYYLFQTEKRLQQNSAHSDQPDVRIAVGFCSHSTTCIRHVRWLQWKTNDQTRSSLFIFLYVIIGLLVSYNPLLLSHIYNVHNVILHLNVGFSYSLK